jgi:hypothetical protein
LGAGGSTWADLEGWAKAGEDVLYQLGKQSPSMRIDMGARQGVIDDLCVARPRCAAAAPKGQALSATTVAQPTAPPLHAPAACVRRLRMLLLHQRSSDAQSCR